MNIDVKIFNKILANIRMIIPHNQVEFIPEMQRWCNICKSISVMHHIDKLKNKNHMIISINAKKAFDNIQHQFMIKKTLKKVEIEAIYINIIKTICDKPTEHPTLWSEAESIFSKIRKITRIPTFTTFIQHSIGSPSHSNQTKKKK